MDISSQIQCRSTDVFDPAAGRTILIGSKVFIYSMILIEHRKIKAPCRESINSVEERRMCKNTCSGNCCSRWLRYLSHRQLLVMWYGVGCKCVPPCLPTLFKEKFPRSSIFDYRIYGSTSGISKEVDIPTKYGTIDWLYGKLVFYVFHRIIEYKNLIIILPTRVVRPAAVVSCGCWVEGVGASSLYR